MDLLGLLEISAQGHHFFLMLVDFTTQYLETVPLNNISVQPYGVTLRNNLLCWNLSQAYVMHTSQTVQFTRD